MTQFKYMLAPLEDFTCPAFRALCYKYGADLTFTEMTRSGALARGNKSTWEKILFNDDTPTVIQLLANNEKIISDFLKDFEPKGNFKGFNLNFGCPSPKIIQTGQGAAMIKRVSKANTIVKTIRDHGYNVNIKMRLGLNRYEKERKTYLNMINTVDADFFIVHARHAGETYSQKPDWSVFEECVKTGKEIIANGDIKSIDDVNTIKNFGVKGVMIGRAAIINPAIFNELKGEKVPTYDEMKNEFLEISKRYNANPKHVDNVLKFLNKKDDARKIIEK